MKYAFITRYKEDLACRPDCRLLGVTRNGYYSYCKRRNTTQPDPEHQEMLELSRRSRRPAITATAHAA